MAAVINICWGIADTIVCSPLDMPKYFKIRHNIFCATKYHDFDAFCAAKSIFIKVSVMVFRPKTGVYLRGALYVFSVHSTSENISVQS